MTTAPAQLDSFFFRDLHPMASFGTASDRYKGWIGQIYSGEYFGDKISSRNKKIKGQTFREEVLPVESLEEFFQHFSVLEIDYTFYGPLLDNDLNVTKNFRVLRTYRQYLHGTDALILKVPQIVFARRLWRGGRFVENPDYLDGELFTRRFYEPAAALLGPHLRGFIFEQEYQPKNERPDTQAFVEELDAFLTKIPRDRRYHVEVRTESLLSPAYFEVLEKYGVGQVLSHWTWLPPLRRQFERGDRRFLNAGGMGIVRLMTPLRVRYEDAYAKAYPFDRLLEGMMDSRMIEETVGIMSAAIDQGCHVNVISNNRAGGNAPLIARKVAELFLRSGIPES